MNEGSTNDAGVQLHLAALQEKGAQVTQEADWVRITTADGAGFEGRGWHGQTGAWTAILRACMHAHVTIEDLLRLEHTEPQ